MQLRLIEKPRRGAALLGGLVLVLASAPAWGGERRLHTSPVTPEAGQEFTISYDSDECQIFFSEGPLDRIVETANSVVHVTVEYRQNQICVPSPSFTWPWSIGPLPQGSYTLVLTGEESLGGGDAIELGRIPLTIRASAATGPRVIPATRPWGLELLVLVMLATALLRIRGPAD